MSRSDEGSVLPEVPVFTFVNDEGEYAQMSRSFVAAGWEPGGLHRLSDRDTDPYAALTLLIATVEAPYFVLCHQDIRLDQGHGLGDLQAAVEALPEGWGVAGNAGCTATFSLVRRLTDPRGGSTGDDLPARVQTLDENLLIVRTGTSLSCTPGLGGFHLYGTDLALRADALGLAAYVLDFHVTHLSSGRAGKRAGGYAECRKAFADAWRRDRLMRLVATPSDVVFLSRIGLLQRALGGARVGEWIRKRPRVARRLAAVIGPG